MSREPVGGAFTAHGAGFQQVIIGKVKMLPPDQPNRIIAAGNGQIHRKDTG